jgi:membrane protein
MRPQEFWTLLKETFNEWTEDKASRLAAALAYYTAISLAPLLVLTVTLLKFLHLNGQQVVEQQMGLVMGKTGQDAAHMMIAAAKEQSGWFATITSFVILLFGASGVFGELQDSLNTIWEVQPRPGVGWIETIKKRFFSLAMVFGVAFLMLVSLIVSTVLSTIVTRFAGEGAVAGLVLDVFLSLLVYSAVFSLIFRYLPDVDIRWRDVWQGALLTAVFFTIGKYLLTLYLSKGSTASAYGAAGSLAALLIWVYYSAQILFFGAEFTQVQTSKYRKQIPTTNDAVPMTEEARAQRGIVREHDLTVAAQAADQLEDRKGGEFGKAVPAAPRVVTITTPESQKGYIVAAAAIVGGAAIAAIGMLRGRKFVRGGIEQLHLKQRLHKLETRARKLPRRQIDLDARLHRIEERIEDVITS